MGSDDPPLCLTLLNKSAFSSLLLRLFCMFLGICYLISCILSLFQYLHMSHNAVLHLLIYVFFMICSVLTFVIFYFAFKTKWHLLVLLEVSVANFWCWNGCVL